MDEIKLGKYKHYKGNFYEVIAIAKHSENLEDLVIYKELKNPDEIESDTYVEPKIWARPTTIFSENVNINGHLVPRFKYLDDDIYTYED